MNAVNGPRVCGCAVVMNTGLNSTGPVMEFVKCATHYQMNTVIVTDRDSNY